MRPSLQNLMSYGVWCLVSKETYKAACDAKTKAVTAAYGVICMKPHVC